MAKLLIEVKESLRAEGATEVPIVGVISDGQHPIHYPREAARPVYEADRHARVQLKKKVRGIRPIERQSEGRDDPEA